MDEVLVGYIFWKSKEDECRADAVRDEQENGKKRHQNLEFWANLKNHALASSGKTSKQFHDRALSLLLIGSNDEGNSLLISGMAPKISSLGSKDSSDVEEILPKPSDDVSVSREIDTSKNKPITVPQSSIVNIIDCSEDSRTDEFLSLLTTESEKQY
ncbi:hypothetical protein FGB62_318g03 [Gracilaria domingensis]|nr:hypothetical protein FGB62_318g03 [Gracilaria domingensis]